MMVAGDVGKQFEAAELQHAIEPHRVLCQDEMLESVGAEELQSRLWDMFPYMMRGVMSLPQLDRVRWIMFPQVRVQTQTALFDDSDADAEMPSIVRVMDIQQEQLARRHLRYRATYRLAQRIHKTANLAVWLEGAVEQIGQPSLRS